MMARVDWKARLANLDSTDDTEAQLDHVHNIDHLSKYLLEIVETQSGAMLVHNSLINGSLHSDIEKAYQKHELKKRIAKAADEGLASVGVHINHVDKLDAMMICPESFKINNK